MELQEEVIFDKNEAMKGTVLYAFIEGQVADENNTYVGRTYRDAPNVDGYIFINTDEELLMMEAVMDQVPVHSICSFHPNVTLRELQEIVDEANR